MPSFREQRNPEALHFPGSYRAKVFIGFAAFFLFVLLIAVFAAGTLLDQTLSAGLILVSLGLCFAAWPREIVLDQNGVSQRGLFSKRSHSWAKIGSVVFTTEFRLPQRKESLPTQCLTILDTSGVAFVNHTPRHDDAQRFAFELQRHGVGLPEELGKVEPPVAPKPPLRHPKDDRAMRAIAR